MSTELWSQALREEIETRMALGETSIPSSIMVAALKNVEALPDNEPDAAAIRRFESELAHGREASIELFRSVITAGQSAIRSMFLLNGGAAVATLAFMGHLASERSPEVVVFAVCLKWFSGGVLMASIVASTTYFSQFFYGGETSCKKKIGICFHVASTGFGLLAYIAFFLGAWRAYDLFSSFTP